MPVQIPDDTDFLSFRDQCESQDGWVARYTKGGVTVWCRDEECKTVQKLKASALQCGSIDCTLTDESSLHSRLKQDQTREDLTYYRSSSNANRFCVIFIFLVNESFIYWRMQHNVASYFYIYSVQLYLFALLNY